MLLLSYYDGVIESAPSNSWEPTVKHSGSLQASWQNHRYVADSHRESIYTTEISKSYTSELSFREPVYQHITGWFSKGLPQSVLGQKAVTDKGSIRSDLMTTWQEHSPHHDPGKGVFSKVRPPFILRINTQWWMLASASVIHLRIHTTFFPLRSLSRQICN